MNFNQSGFFGLQNHGIIYASVVNLPQQGFTSPLKKADRRVDSGCLRMESDSKLPKAGDCRGVYACRVKRGRKGQMTFLLRETAESAFASSRSVID